MKILICGSRDYKNWNQFHSICCDILSKIQWEYGLSVNDFEIIEGAEPNGADHLASIFSQKVLGKKSTQFPAKWDDLNVPNVKIKYNAKGEPYNSIAGFQRNTLMLKKLSDGDIVIAFHKNNSPGTADTIKQANKLGIRTFIVKIP